MPQEQIGTPTGRTEVVSGTGTDPARTPGASGITAAQFARMKDNNALDAACTAINSTLYTAAYLNSLTANDKQYVIALNPI